MTQEKRTIKQVLAYLLVGGGTAVLELALFQILYALTPLGAGVSNVVAVVVATACNFALNGTVTFQRSSNLARSIMLYCLLFAFNTAFSTTIITMADSIGVPAILAKLATMACIVCWNFILYKKVVFA